MKTSAGVGVPCDAAGAGAAGARHAASPPCAQRARCLLHASFWHGCARAPWEPTLFFAEVRTIAVVQRCCCRFCQRLGQRYQRFQGYPQQVRVAPTRQRATTSFTWRAQPEPIFHVNKLCCRSTSIIHGRSPREMAREERERREKEGRGEESRERERVRDKGRDRYNLFCLRVVLPSAKVTTRQFRTASFGYADDLFCCHWSRVILRTRVPQHCSNHRYG